MILYAKSAVSSVVLATCLVISGCSDSVTVATPETADDAPAADPIGVSATDPSVEPAAEPVVEPAAQPAADPVVEPVVAPNNEPAVDPVIEPAVAPVVDSDPSVAPTDTDNIDSFPDDTSSSDAEVVALPPANDDSQVSDGASQVVGNVSATGADTIDGPEDDSPTQTESLSRAGPFVRDTSRAAGPPSAPTGLTRLLAAENWVEFSWAPSSDDQSVEAYEIYRDGVLIGTVRHDSTYEHDIRSWISTSFIDCNYTRYANCVSDNLQPQEGASYAYTVVAVDNEGMRSPPSEEAVFSMATPSQSTVDLSAYSAVFTEEFDGTSLDRSRWKTSLPWGPDTIINLESQYFVNTFGSGNLVDYDPFVLTGDTLQITGIQTPPDQLAAANGQPYLSGVLTSSDHFELTYGYVEMRAKLASGEGMLSTFFLFNQGFYKNKPEIDIIEYLGGRPDKAYQTYHYFDSNRARDSRGEKHSSPTMETVTNQDLSNDFHTYGVLWEPELVIFYIDGVEVRRLEGVRVSDEPMNIVTQLVMGSEWIGDPDPAKVPAVVEIDYIRAFQK